MSTGVDSIAAIGDHLRAHPAHRFPLEHAAGQFHLGIALVEEGRVEEARAALELASELFAGRDRPVELAKARNGLGAVLRLLGDPAAAADAFTQAAEAFADGGLAAEQGAALFNLGLARRESGEQEGARDAFAQARSLLDGTAPPAQVGAAARELGATLLLLGDGDAAAEALAQAVELAARGRDTAGVGSAANALGLAHLAAGRTEQATAAFHAAVTHHHRTLHPEGHAMAQANLALAYEQAGDALRARTAARHALGVPAVPPPVREQATAILDRLPPQPGDAVALLLDEPRERWPALMRTEIAWWLDAGDEAREAAAAGWVAAQAASDDFGEELAHALLGAALELPAEATDRVVAAVVRGAGAADPQAAARFRAQVARALPRFHLPQWQRLEQSLDRLASEAGQAPWSIS